MNVGFIGLGLMGRPLAQHLAAAGHTLHLWARRPESLAAFAESGARTHPSPAEVARHADVVITMVADAPDVRAVILGADGIAAGGRPGLIVIDMSTINPNAAREIGSELAAQGIQAEQLLVTPTFFNSLLWRVVAVQGGHYHEGFHSLLDASPQIGFERYDRGRELAASVQPIDGARRLMAFSKGFYKLWQADGQVFIADLRMGQEPDYIFTFVIARRESPPVPLAVPEQVGSRPDLARGLPWLWRRALGEPLPPPR